MSSVRKKREKSVENSNGLILNFEYLDKTAEKNHTNYVSAMPFPHCIIDDFLPQKSLKKIISEYPSVNDDNVNWERADEKKDENNHLQFRKFWISDETQLKQNIRQLIWELNSGKFSSFLEKLTGIQGLISDPKLFGGGLHQNMPGAVLAIHADFNKHPVSSLDRRLNLLLFLNENWKEEYGGYLELWTSDMSECKSSILPKSNRCVIFNTTSTSYHGHPTPVKCPEGMSRKSISMYYYSNGRPEEEQNPEHSTLWQNRPES